ncbi:MAG: tRNA (adenosine(37)-N6)-threonylcarbamoyltransferase complex ATPase subunit type 1 TsaE [Thermovirgaceae bacterium]|nr:tRNA (adenosine(37)-N6)-threonylcarbamoyltransferase complex ATPase subunit type 1 TsaE [Thermovirgaceae bacterium]
MLNDPIPERPRHDGEGVFLRFLSSSPEETRLLGESIFRFCLPGMFILLYGNLGSGKTEFVRGFARGAGWDDVRSPSFTIVNEYPTEPPIVHVDLYRIDEGSSSEFSLEEYSRDGCVTLVEWAERWEIPPLMDILEARFYSMGDLPGNISGDDRLRVIDLSCSGEGACEGLKRFLPEFDDLLKRLGH